MTSYKKLWILHYGKTMVSNTIIQKEKEKTAAQTNTIIP